MIALGLAGIQRIARSLRKRPKAAVSIVKHFGSAAKNKLFRAQTLFDGEEDAGSAATFYHRPQAWSLRHAVDVGFLARNSEQTLDGEPTQHLGLDAVPKTGVRLGVIAHVLVTLARYPC